MQINPDGKRTILALDGGGMRGLITAAMLAELEAAAGRPCRELFDMVAGTSTGALLTAAVVLGIPMQQVVEEIYRARLPAAFPRPGLRLAARYVLHGTRHLYSAEPFIRALHGYGPHGLRIGDIRQPLVLITARDMRSGALLHIMNAGPGAPLFADYPLAGVVAASSAAPVMFAPVAGDLIDGGVGMDVSPALAAAVEAMETLGAEAGFTDGRVMLLSLGTGYAPHGEAEGAAARYGLRRWLTYLTRRTLDDSALHTAWTAQRIYGRRIDFRRYNVLLTRQNALALGVDPGRCVPERLALDSRRPEDIAFMEAVGRAYARGLDWTRPGLMPWDTAGGHARPAPAPIDWSTTPYL